MVKKKEVVYIVGIESPDSGGVSSAHKTLQGALKSWNKLRKELLNKAKYYLKNSNSKDSKDMFGEIVKNLSCEDYKLIDNYPHETPCIREYKLRK